MDLVLFDDDVTLLDSIRRPLELRGFHILGAAGTIAEASELLRRVDPDIAVIGIQVPEGSNLSLARRLLLDHPGLAVMIYTRVEDAGILAEALECGARGFALKIGGVEKLIGGLRQVARGERYVDPVIRALLDARVGGRRLLLTTREREVFELLAEGLTGEEIAVRLTVSPETIRTHIRNGMEKLGAHTRTGAVVQALKSGEI
jgi:DNA-binding NarL/FixJ family response regulator